MPKLIEDQSFHIVNPSELWELERSLVIEKMVWFFEEQVLSLLERFPSFGEESIAKYIQDHTKDELEKKILEKNRFFRLVQTTEGEIIGYFESRQDEREYGGNYEIAQWLLIKEGFRKNGLSKELWKSFFDSIDLYLEDNNLTHIDIISFCKQGNKESVKMHLANWFNCISINHESDDYVWKLTRRREK